LRSRRFWSLLALASLSLGITTGVQGSATAGSATAGSATAGSATAATSPADNVVVSFTFDDARSSQYGVLPVFGAHGMRATFYVNTGLMGTTGIMSWAQLHDIADAGHEIGGHTVSHTGLTEVNEATARAEIQGDITNLQAHGFPRPISFAYPYGYYGPPEEGYVRDAGYASARTTDIYTRESIPPADPYALRMIRPGFDGSDGLAALQQDVTSAEAAPGTTWLIYLMHDFYSPINDEIADFLAWLEPRAANGTVVKTMGEVLSSTPTNQPPVASAGSAQTVSAGSTVQLDGSGSSDPNGDPLTYQWTQTGGPAVTLSSGTVVAPTFTAPTSASTLTFQLVVNDGTVSSSPSSVTITVQSVAGPTYRSSSSTGNDAFGRALNVPVPSGAAASDVVVVAVSTWGSTAPTITAPAGFTLKASYTGTTANGGADTTKIYWKRLTVADTGRYRFTWSSSRWAAGHAVAISGAVNSGDPIESINRANSASATTFPSTSVTTTAPPLLAWFGRNDEAAPGVHTPPAGFTEVQDKDSTGVAYRRPGSAGTYAATGATYIGTANPVQAVLVAVKS
jgi:peptidoglycan/xylan/chitin deacetylase (PgdA/CDA1 family)